MDGWVGQVACSGFGQKTLLCSSLSQLIREIRMLVEVGSTYLIFMETRIVSPPCPIMGGPRVGCPAAPGVAALSIAQPWETWTAGHRWCGDRSVSHFLQRLLSLGLRDSLGLMVKHWTECEVRNPTSRPGFATWWLCGPEQVIFFPFSGSVKHWH